MSGARDGAELLIKTSSGRIAALSSHLRPPMATSSSSPSSSSEVEAALAAAPSDAPTIFDKIIKKEIPSKVVYEDDKTMVRTCTGRGGGAGHGACCGRGAGRSCGVLVEPEGSDRLQRSEDQIAALAGLVQQIAQQQAVVATAPAPPPVQVPGGVVDPPAAPAPPVVIATATTTTFRATPAIATATSLLQQSGRPLFSPDLRL